MNIAPDCKTNEITIAGVTFIVPAPFVEGHVLTAGEAAVLNQTFAENIRNNMAGRVKKGLDEKTEDTAVVQADVDAYIASYDFGVRRTGTTRTVLNPVDRELHKLAGDKVKEALRKKGIALKDVTKEQLEKLVTQTVEKYPQLRAQAEKIVALKKKVADETLELDLE